ncbi:hypothetical protein BS17DRAFT_763637 [Gyrodon lividus]|nr:hypothetical protein BS17DRAFT_763637 [Gyrodon lividus]
MELKRQPDSGNDSKPSLKHLFPDIHCPKGLSSVKLSRLQAVNLVCSDFCNYFEFNQDWDFFRLDAKLRTLFPHLFAYLNDCSKVLNQEYLPFYLLYIRSQKEIAVFSGVNFPTGKNTFEKVKAGKRPSRDKSNIVQQWAQPSSKGKRKVAGPYLESDSDVVINSDLDVASSFAFRIAGSESDDGYGISQSLNLCHSKHQFASTSKLLPHFIIMSTPPTSPQPPNTPPALMPPQPFAPVPPLLPPFQPVQPIEDIFYEDFDQFNAQFHQHTINFQRNADEEQQQQHQMELEQAEHQHRQNELLARQQAHEAHLFFEAEQAQFCLEAKQAHQHQEAEQACQHQEAEQIRLHFEAEQAHQPDYAHQCLKAEQIQLHFEAEQHHQNEVAQQEHHLTQQHREYKQQQHLDEMYGEHNQLSQEQHDEDEQRHHNQQQGHDDNDPPPSPSPSPPPPPPTYTISSRWYTIQRASSDKFTGAYGLKSSPNQHIEILSLACAA